MLWMFLLFECGSIFICCVMVLSDAFNIVIKRKDLDDKPFLIGLMAVFGGWMFFPYFVYLAIKYFKIKRKSK